MYSQRRSSALNCALSDATRLRAIETAVPLETVTHVLDQHHCIEQRCRKLSMGLTVYLVIAMNLFARERLGLVLERLLHTWHWLSPETNSAAGDPAIHYRREQLGVAPMVDLFHQVCRPMATESTRGAFLFGLRLMAADGKRMNLADHPALAEHFGRPTTDRGDGAIPGAFPQALLVTLTEVGTHAYVDAGVWPCRMGEHAPFRRLLRSVCTGMLVLMDRGLYSADNLLQVRSRGAHVLCRLPQGVKPQMVKRLSDGSCLVRIAPAAHHPHQPDEGMLVRLISYTLQDPNNPGHGQVYRLVTTLLDPKEHPAHALALAYHERWEQEAVYDETEVHLLHGDAPLRSRSVAGVVQEIYGLLIGHYCIRALMHQAALHADIDPDEISFTATLVLVQEAIRDFQLAAPALHPYLFERLLTDISQHRVQQREPRSYPRVVKRKMSNYPLKRTQRPGYSRCKPYKEAIALI